MGIAYSRQRMAGYNYWQVGFCSHVVDCSLWTHTWDFLFTLGKFHMEALHLGSMHRCILAVVTPLAQNQII